ncbi:hypothetical protein [Lentzea jiangxiensis]|uniref:hypothetical protein n=1 Tax=Lentzea jiangxiensis TaxID=641025 RepID=UPI00115FEFE2|nr:hypothetical protein [Lentzea jiangxiensis]
MSLSMRFDSENDADVMPQDRCATHRKAVRIWPDERFRPNWRRRVDRNAAVRREVSQLDRHEASLVAGVSGQV